MNNSIYATTLAECHIIHLIFGNRSHGCYTKRRGPPITGMPRWAVYVTVIVNIGDSYAKKCIAIHDYDMDNDEKEGYY